MTEPIAKLLERVHRRAAPALAGMCLALAARRASVGSLEAWARELRDCADALDRWARDYREKD